MKSRSNTRISPNYLNSIKYIIVGVWTVFTFASFSTTREIFNGSIFQFSSGLHFENYIKAWKTNKVSVYFSNSLLYTMVSCSVPASYVLSRFVFKRCSLIEDMFPAALGILAVMIIMPLFSLTTVSRLTIIVLYTCLQVAFSTFFLLSFFKNLSRSFEECADIDGCSPMKTFWLIIFPLAQPFIITLSIFNFITIWNEYFMGLIFANTIQFCPVVVGLYSMIQSMKYTGNCAGMFAAVVIVFLPTFYVIYFFLKDYSRWYRREL